MAVELTNMTVDDYDDVRALWEQAKGVGVNDADTRAGLQAYLRRNPGLSFVARDGSQLVGAVLCGHEGRRGYLHHLAVAATHRRRGIGSSLVERCLERLSSLGFQKCNILVYADNDEGAKFWDRGGWVEQPDWTIRQRTTMGDVETDRLDGYPGRMVTLLGDRDPLEVLAATPDILDQSIRDHSIEVLRTRPYEGKWTPNEILGHLVENEFVAGFRLRSVLYDDQPVIAGYRQESWADGQAHNDSPPTEFMTTFRVIRQANLRLFESLSEADLRKVGHRADRGRESVGLMLSMMAGHDLSHLDQLWRYIAAVNS